MTPTKREQLLQELEIEILKPKGLSYTAFAYPLKFLSIFTNVSVENLTQSFFAERVDDVLKTREVVLLLIQEKTSEMKH